MLTQVLRAQVVAPGQKVVAGPLHGDQGGRVLRVLRQQWAPGRNADALRQRPSLACVDDAAPVPIDIGDVKCDTNLCPT